jgi:hypothetical protein
MYGSSWLAEIFPIMAGPAAIESGAKVGDEVAG